MEEAEALCDRLGIFVNGALRCIGNAKELTSSDPEMEVEISSLVQRISEDASLTYSIFGTQKFQVPSQVSTAQLYFLQQ